MALAASAQAAPGNDDFVNAEALSSSLPQNEFGENEEASKQAGEPNHAGNAGGHSVWYSWTPSSSGQVSISTCTFGNLDTLLAVYTGSAVNALTPVTSNDDATAADCESTDSEVVFSASAGTTYKIAVDGKNGGEGFFELELTGRPANDDFSSAAAIEGSLPGFAFGSNKLATKQAGEPNHAGNAGGHSVWFTWTPSSSSAVTIRTCSNLDTLLAVYTGSAVNALTPVASNDDSAGGCGSSNSGLSFSASAGTTYRIAVDGKDGDQGSFELQLNGPPANDDFANAQTISPTLPGFVSGSNTFATKQAGEPNHAGNAGGHSVWYSWTPSSSGPVAISTCIFGNPDTLLAVYTGSAVNSLTPVASNDDSSLAGCGTGSSAATFNASAGTTYRIAVDGKDGDEGSFQLQLKGPPSNDDFASAQTISASLPQFASGSNLLASKQAGEPNHAGNAGGQSIWFAWTPSSSGPVEFSTCFSSPDTLLAVYTGSAVNSLTPVASNDDGAECFSGGGSEVSFTATAGTTYRIAVDSKGSAQGSIQLQLKGPPSNDDFANPQVLTSSLPSSGSGVNKLATKQAGEPNHAGDAGGHSLWYSWTPSSSGSVEISTCSSFSGNLDTLLAVYTGSAVNALTPVASNDDAGGCRSSDSVVEFNASAGTTYRIAVDGKDGSLGSFNLQLNGPPANDDFASAQVLSAGLPASASGTNKAATKQAGEPNHAGNAGGHSVWYSWTPSSSGPVAISTCAFSGPDTLLAVYTGSAVNALTPVASNDDSSSFPCSGSEVLVMASAGTTYRIAVDGKNGSRGSFELHVVGAPANDDFANAEELSTGLPDYVGGTTKLASKQAGEPNHAGEPGGHSVWYSWTADESGPVSISTCDSSFSGLDTLLAVYTGSAVNSLTPVASNDDGPISDCSDGDSEVRFNAVDGTTYRIAVDAFSDRPGAFQLELSGRPSNDDFANATNLGSNSSTTEFTGNRLATKQAGEPSHAGDPGGHSVWFTWTPASSGSVEISTCPNYNGGPDTLLGVYTGSAVNALTPVASNDDAPIFSSEGSECAERGGSAVTFAASAGTTYRIAVDGKHADEGPFSIRLQGRATNDDFANAQTLSGGFASGSNKFATKQAGEPNHAGSPGGHSVWYSWTPSSSGSFEISTCSSYYGSLDTLLGVYTGSAVNSLTPVVSNDDAGGCRSTDSAVQLNASAGTTYLIAVDGKGGSEGSFEVSLHGKPSNDDFAQAQTVSGSFASGSNRLATKEAGEPNHAGNAGGHSVWFRWTPSRSGTAEISSCFSGLDTLLAVYTGSAVNSLTPIASNDDDASGEESCNSTASRVSFIASAGTTYKIAVDGKNGAQGSFELSFSSTPENDDFADATTLFDGPSTSTSTTLRSATKEAGEPNHAGNAGGHSVWFNWTPASSGPVDISTCTFSGVDTLLAVYTGSAVNALTPVASNDDSGAGNCESATDSEVSFSASAGTTYRIAIDGKNGSTGSVELILAGIPANDDLAHAQPLGARLPTGISSRNTLATKQAGEPNHAGNAGGHSVWFKWTSPITGEVGVDTCGSDIDTLLAVYTGSAVNSLTPVASNDDACGGDSRLAFEATAGTTYKIAVDGKGGAQGSFELDINGRPSNDDFADAKVIASALPRSLFGSTKLAGKQAGEPNHAGNAGGHSVWYSWTPLSSGQVTVDTCFPSFDTLLAVYTGSAVNSLTPVASNDNAPTDGGSECSEGGGSEVAFTASAGTTYRIAIDGVAGAEGGFALDLKAIGGVQRRLLSVSKSGTGGGAVSSSPAGIDCGASCEGEFDQGTTVTLTATPDSGSTFTGWSGGGCSGSGSCQMQLDANSAVTANFTENPPGQHSLTVSKSGTGGGTVSSNPAGIDCGLTCSNAFDEGTVVTLNAAPASDSAFAGWSGSGCSGAATCVVTMSAARSVTATFDAKPSEEGGGGGGGGGGGTPGGTTTTPAAQPQPPPPAPVASKPKPALKCKAGFKKKTVHGKAKCVKKKKKKAKRH